MGGSLADALPCRHIPAPAQRGSDKSGCAKNPPGEAGRIKGDYQLGEAGQVKGAYDK